MSSDSNRMFVGRGSSEQVFGGDRNRSFRMSSFVSSWNDVGSRSRSCGVEVRNSSIFEICLVRHFQWELRSRPSVPHGANFTRLLLSIKLNILQCQCSYGLLLWLSAESRPLTTIFTVSPHWSVLSLPLQRSIILPISQIVEQLYSFPSSRWFSLHSSFKNFLNFWLW